MKKIMTVFKQKGEIYAIYNNDNECAVSSSRFGLFRPF
jgi:hypothetical protein